MGRAKATKAVKKEDGKPERVDDDASKTGGGLELVKMTQPRGQPFDLELGADFSVRLQMFVKNVEAKPEVTFTPIGAAESKQQQEESKDLKKVRRYETQADSGVRVAFEDIDQTGDDTFQRAGASASAKLPGGREVAKEDVIKGYRYGGSLIPVSKEEEQLMDFPRKGKQLQLIQFTKRANILPQFLLTNCRYLLPYANDSGALNTLSTLVEAMLGTNTVALCRYAYNVNSNPRVVCLIPKRTKSGYPVLMHYQLPFNEDIRSFEFPSLEDIGGRPTDYQMDLVDEYINTMDLSGRNGSGEQIRCRDVKNPKFVHMSTIMKHRAAHPTGDLPALDKHALLKGLEPPKNPSNDKDTRVLLDDIKEQFKLALNPYTRVAAFKQKKVEVAGGANGQVKVEGNSNGSAAVVKQEGGVAGDAISKSEKMENGDN